jgi:hypothetical protein
MSDSYKVKVNDSFSFDINKESISQLDAVPTEQTICMCCNTKN